MTKKRQRIILVCDNCHNRKIKCNRKLPCDSCTNRGIASLCCYTTLEKELAKQGKSTKMIKSGEGTSDEIIALRNKVKELEDHLRNNGLMIPVGGGQTPLSENSSPNLLHHNSILSLGSDHGFSIPRTNSSDNTNENCNGDHNNTDFFFNHGSDIFCTRIQETFVFSCPISYILIIKRDVAYILFWHYNRLIQQRDAFRSQFVSGVGPLLDNDTLLSDKYEQEAKAYFGDGFIPKYDPNIKNDDSLIKRRINLYNADVALLFYPNYIPPNLNILSKIYYVLPPREIVLEYLEIFFDKMHEYFPIFDKLSFTNDIKKILVLRNETKLTINIEQKNDIAKVASLLFILRFTYLFAMKDQKSRNDYGSVLQHPVYVEAALFGKECLKEFNLGLNLSFEGLQSYLMAKVYKTFAQDECDALRETDLYIHSLVMCASTLGLNRDPDIYIHDEITWLTKTNRRKIWFLILNLECHELGIYGRPIYNDLFSDVKLEEINIPGDDVLYNTMSKFMTIRPVVRDFLRTLLNIREPVNLDYLTNRISTIENLVNATYKPIGELIDNLSNGKTDFNPNDLVELQSHLCLKLFLLKLYLAAYIIFEKKANVNLLFYYYKKMITLLYVELNPFLVMLNDANSTIHPMTHIILTPIFIRFYFMYNITIITLIIHLNYSIKLYLGTDNKLKHFFNLIDDFKFLCSNSLKYAGKVSKTYYLSWKAMKACIYGMRETDGLRTFSEFCQGKSAAWIFTLEQVHELCDIIGSVVSESKQDADRLPISDSFKWFNFVPYDHSKSTEDNLLIQRYHLSQMDGVWLHYVSTLKESIPNSFLDDGQNSTQIPNLLNADIIEPGLEFMNGFGNFFQSEDFFLADSFYGPLS